MLHQRFAWRLLLRTSSLLSHAPIVNSPSQSGELWCLVDGYHAGKDQQPLSGLHGPHQTELTAKRQDTPARSGGFPSVPQAEQIGR